VESAGAGTPILFILGGTASAREWRPVLPLLTEHAECVAIDRLGCRRCEKHNGPLYTVPLYLPATESGWQALCGDCVRSVLSVHPGMSWPSVRQSMGADPGEEGASRVPSLRRSVARRANATGVRPACAAARL
jgi:pimeloyl-ACP methyl ester carboxylesterase